MANHEKISWTQALVARSFEIIVSLFFIGYSIYLFSVTSKNDDIIKVYDLEMPKESFIHVILGILVIHQGFILLSSFFFMFVATRPDSTRMVLFMFVILPLEKILIGIISLLLIIIFASPGSQSILGSTLTVILLAVWSAQLVDSFFILFFLIAISREKKEFSVCLSKFWPLRHLLFIFLNSAVIVYFIMNYAGFIDAICIIFSVVSILILLSLIRTDFNDCKIKSRDVQEILLPKSVYQILKMARQLMREKKSNIGSQTGVTSTGAKKKLEEA